MKKMIVTLALTLTLTVGIASPISAMAQTKPTPISPVAKDGPACFPGASCLINQTKPSPILPVAKDGPACFPGASCLIN